MKGRVQIEWLVTAQAADWFWLEVLASVVGVLVLVPGSHLVVSSGVRNFNIPKELRRRMLKYMTTLIVAGLLWIVQELVAVNTIRYW